MQKEPLQTKKERSNAQPSEKPYKKVGKSLGSPFNAHQEKFLAYFIALFAQKKVKQKRLHYNKPLPAGNTL